MEVPKPAKEATPPHSDNVKLALLPEHDSGVSGIASFEEISEGVLVKLELRGLPKPNALYLAHIHPGTCAQEAEGEPHKHGEHAEKGHQHRHEHGGGIEYLLSQVEPTRRVTGRAPPRCVRPPAR